MTVRCACCGRTVDWSTLEVVDRLETDNLCALVTHWQDGVSVEVRRSSCGNTIAPTARR